MYGDMFQSFFYMMKRFGIRQKDLPNYIREIRSGWRRIRTFEGIASRFTVCPLWPLGNPSVNEFIIYKEESFCKIFFQLFWIFCMPERV